jgi:hypothetical protein
MLNPTVHRGANRSHKVRWWESGCYYRRIVFNVLAQHILLIALLNLPPTWAECCPFPAQSLYSYSPLTLFCILASFFPHQVRRTRENTTKSKSVSHPFKSTSFPPLDPTKYWPDLPHWLKRLSYTPTSIPFAFPSCIGPFFHSCGLLVMSFYNMFLCSAGYTWDGWSFRVTKLAVPTSLKKVFEFSRSQVPATYVCEILKTILVPVVRKMTSPILNVSQSNRLN